MKLSRRAALLGGLAGGLGSALGARAGIFEFGYDALGRLNKVVYPNRSAREYEYDDAGNRKLKAFATTLQVTGTPPVNLRTLANTAGYLGGDARVIFEVANGVTIMGDAGASGPANGMGGAGGVAIDTGTWPGGQSIILTLLIRTGGEVYGGGGGGGGGAGAPGDYGYGGDPGGGGAAVVCGADLNIEIEPLGRLQGGAQGGRGGLYGEEILLDVSTGDYAWASAGGGGGGFPNGLGGAGGYGQPMWFDIVWDDGDPGGDGTTSGPGAGGAGGFVTGPYGDGDGDMGSAGADYQDVSCVAVAKNGHTVTIVNKGFMSGSVV